jgi:transposase
VEIVLIDGRRLAVEGALNVEVVLRLARGLEAPMIPVPMGVKVWLATGHADMRKGFASLALQVQEVLRRDPLGGRIFCLRGRRGDLLKVIWHDGEAANLYVRRLERGPFLWPSPTDRVVKITPAPIGCLLSAINWRNPQETWRPTSIGWLKGLGHVLAELRQIGLASQNWRVLLMEGGAFHGQATSPVRQ